MKTPAELIKENEQLKQQVQHLKLIADSCQAVVKDYRVTLRQYQTALGIRTLSVVKS